MEKNVEIKKSEKNVSTFGNYKISFDNQNNLDQNFNNF